jgi:hypothetical protein
MNRVAAARYEGSILHNLTQYPSNLLYQVKDAQHRKSQALLPDITERRYVQYDAT